MPLSPFHALYTARELSSYAHSADRLVAAYASSDIEVYPYQIAAAQFALRSPYLKGVVLADEGSLGKTYEALLVITQLYFEGKERILLVVPTPLLHQWWGILQDNFSVDFQIHAEGDCTFDFKGIILTTYDFATTNAEKIGNIVWDAVVFEEAHRIAKPDNKTTIALKTAVGNAFKILLTATPMQNSIMDLYGLIDFIDTGALGDADAFYKRYFRKPENYGELTATASRYCFRTLRSQVEGYVKIPNRIPVTADYPLSAKEVKLATMVDAYLEKPEKQAFPKMDGYDLTLMFKRALSSSPWALCNLADTAVGRVRETELVEMATFAADITPQSTGKGQALLKALKTAFAGLKKRGANRKAIIFTESLATIGFLHKLLEDTYKVVAFDGSKSSDYSVIKKFENEAEILITTDVAAEGFHLAFCSLVINFDLPYNVLTLEQRIMRCHRQGQQNDVVVLNFLKKDNFADVRMLELINKRVSQFDGIMGMSDDVVGNFTENAADGITTAFEQARHREDIEAEFQAGLAAHEDDNANAVEQAENALFTTFTRDIADKVTVTPQYIKDRTAEINAKLWKLIKWFFTGKSGYSLEEETRTLHVGIQSQKVFTGASLRRREYSIDDKSIEKSGRLTVSCSLAKNMISEIFWRGIADRGTVTANSLPEPCTVAYYQVKIKAGYFGGVSYFVFTGKTKNGQFLSDEDCREIIGLPIIQFTAEHETYGERDGLSKKKSPHDLDTLINPADYIARAVSDTDEARREEIEAVRDRAYHRKQTLSRDIEVLKGELRQIESNLSRTASVTERVAAEKKKSTASRDLKSREQSLFMDSMKADVEAENAIKKLTEQANLTAEIKRQFVIEMIGGTSK
ncbi:MAG: DEAD/DEAH box helicase [Oscillospiraceae bacterium]|nr:DEAD/DEAH box helicase [Oscillospiraceae bacterium]